MVHCLLFLPVITVFLLTIKKAEKLYIIPFIMLFIFAAVRYGFGNDYFSYQNIYNNIQNGHIENEEYLYTLLNIITPNFYVLIAITSLAFIATAYLLVKKNVSSQYVCFSILIFVINTFALLINLSAIRQCLAMIIFICSTHFANKKNFIGYIILILVATMFHRSAIMLLPFYFIANDKPINKGTILVIIIVILATLLGNVIPYFANFLTTTLFNDANYTYYVSTSTNNSLRATLLSSVFLIYTLFNIPHLKGNVLVYAKLYLVGTIFSVFAIKLSMLTRLQMYFDMFSIVVLPMIFKQTAEKDAVVCRSNIFLSLWNILNKYLFPVLLLVIYCLRYYSFFANPLWRPFAEYKTIFSLL